MSRAESTAIRDGSVERLLTVPELAAVLGLHEKTVYDLAARRVIPSYKIGTARRFRVSEVESWLARQRA
jgi:excisionase family DNA binding protein